MTEMVISKAKNSYRKVMTVNTLHRGKDMWGMYTFFLRTFLTAEVFLNQLGFLDHIQLTHKVGLLWKSDQPMRYVHVD
jgi:hypothetical protein